MVTTVFSLFMAVMVMSNQGPEITVVKLDETFSTEAACEYKAKEVYTQLQAKDFKSPVVIACRKEIPGKDI